ncbi:MAG: hypothetical protein WCK00_14195 [Deltaproteobacteria bacterium]
MKRPCKWILLPIILIITLIAGIDEETLAAEGIFGRELFRVSERLFPDFRDAGAKKMTPFRDDFSVDGRKFTEGADLRAEGDRQRRLLDVRFRYFHLFVSRTVSGEGTGRDVVRPEDERNSLLTTVQSFPGLLRSDPAGAIESVGRIFAPQVNLGIEF